MKFGLLLFALVSFFATKPLSSKPEPPQAAVSPSEAMRLLDSSYAAANELNPAERVFYLTYLTAIAGDIESQSNTIDTHRTQAWCNELFSLAFQMPIGHDRIATEKNALMQLSKVDPQSALRR